MYLPPILRQLWRYLQRRYQIFKADQKARQDLLNWTERDDVALRFYRQFIPPHAVCFDVGANVGNRTKIFVKLASKVIAVEPQERCARVLAALQRRSSTLQIICKALGSSEGEAEIYLSDVHSLSSLSPGWIDTAKRSNRFGGDVWNRKRRVELTTLDQLISEQGWPAFIKIDVEGFEYEVIQGLSQCPACLSLEFVPERLEPTFNCFARLSELGSIELNYSLGEEFSLQLSSWVGVNQMKDILLSLPDNVRVFGDVYIRFQRHQSRCSK